MQYTDYHSEQYIFDRNLGALGLIVKLLAKAFLFAPLLLTGYVLAGLVLDKNETSVLWISSVLIFSLMVFLLIYLIKGLISGLLEAGNILWLPLLLLCITYTCLGPTWYVFQSIDKFMLRLNPEAGRIFTWLISGSVGIYTYWQYGFLSRRTPRIAQPAYQLGYGLVKRSN